MDTTTFLLRLRRAQSLHLRISHPEYARIEVPECQAGEFIEAVLSPATSVEVVTLDESSRPVSEVRVRFWRREIRREGVVFDRREGVTDADGICLFSTMEPGKGTIQVVHSHLGSPNWFDIDILPDEANTVEIVLPAGRTIHGYVVDAATEQPVAGATVAPYSPDRYVLTDVDGYYELPGWTGAGVEETVGNRYGTKLENVVCDKL